MEAISTFDIFKIGVGPSSSHTMGPWRAAQQFLQKCNDLGIAARIQRLKCDLYGSLAKTGKGHGTDIALMLGLSGDDPVTCDVSQIQAKVDAIRSTKVISLAGVQTIPFDPAKEIVFHFDRALPFHPNGLTFSATLEGGQTHEETYYSIGGGFVVQQQTPEDQQGKREQMELPFALETAEDLLNHCRASGLSIPEIVRRNERVWRSDVAISRELAGIWQAMRECIYRGCQTGGELPGPLHVARRAARIHASLMQHITSGSPESGPVSFPSLAAWQQAVRERAGGFQQTLQWVSCFALAVNEENAAFGRVVTAPTNGAAGVIPAVLMYYDCFAGGTPEGIEDFLLTAAVIGMLFKKGATISAAMGGCQAEIGVSSAMAAAGLCQVFGGSPERVLMAAEIAMEHHLGMTCDPIGGLVQIPCIERNTMGAIKAITAANLALASDPSQAKVPLDTVINTMWATAQDMSSKYKETSEGGLAVQIPVNVSEC